MFVYMERKYTADTILRSLSIVTVCYIQYMYVYTMYLLYVIHIDYTCMYHAFFSHVHVRVCRGEPGNKICMNMYNVGII